MPKNGLLKITVVNLQRIVFFVKRTVVDGELASINYTSVLNANAYGARGTYRMSGTHWFEKQDESWISINDPKH